MCVCVCVRERERERERVSFVSGNIHKKTYLFESSWYLSNSN